MRIALLGTRGVPARYGGFETAVGEIGPRLVEAGHEVVVYCRNPGQTMRQHDGMRLVNLPALRQRSLETLSHTGLSVVHAAVRARPDVAIVFNVANAPFLPVLRGARIPTAVHLDGLEWQRAKWAGAGARYYKAAEGWGVRLADAVIADARGIADHVRTTYGHESVFIPYGAPVLEPGHHRLAELGLQRGGYHLVVARLEPENNVHVVLDGYVSSSARLPLVVVGSAPYAARYGDELDAAAAVDARVRMIGAVWDQEQLDQLYAGARSYLHGHSVGGTNPSLLRALGSGAAVTAYDVVFNREVTAGHARYFSTPEQVRTAVEADEADEAGARERGTAGRDHVAATYTWAGVAQSYDDLCRRLYDLRSGRAQA
jgi:glycosyltransferase involved in cell wall biosynthesis